MRDALPEPEVAAKGIDWNRIIERKLSQVQDAKHPHEVALALDGIHAWTKQLYDSDPIFQEEWAEVGGDAMILKARTDPAEVTWQEVREAEQAVAGLLSRCGMGIETVAFSETQKAAANIRAYLDNHVLGDGTVPRPVV